MSIPSFVFSDYSVDYQWPVVDRLQLTAQIVLGIFVYSKTVH